MGHRNRNDFRFIFSITECILVYFSISSTASAELIHKINSLQFRCAGFFFFIFQQRENITKVQMELNHSRLKSNPHLHSSLTSANFKDAILMHVTLCLFCLIWGNKIHVCKGPCALFNCDNDLHIG